MTNPTLAAALDYLARGWSLVPVGSDKLPIWARWNDPANLVRDAARATEVWGNGHVRGIGLHLATSGVASLDVDDLALARVALAAVGVDVEVALAAGWLITRGNANKGRAEFRAPEGLTFRNLRVPKPPSEWRVFRNPQTGRERRVITFFNVFELRAARSNLQDVLPPSQHPDGTCYQAAPVPEALPEMPDAVLNVWRNWSESREAMLTALGVKSEVLRELARGVRPESVASRYRDAYNAVASIEDLLERNGYERAGENRWRHPGSKSTAGLRPFVSQDATSPLLVSENFGDPLYNDSRHPVDAWAVHVILEHGGDVRGAEAQFREEHPTEAAAAWPAPADEFDVIDIPALKEESRQIGDGEPVDLSAPATLFAGGDVHGVDDLADRMVFAEHGGFVLDRLRPKLSMSYTTFRAATSTLPPAIGHRSGKQMSAADAWLQHSRRRTVVTSAFEPGKPEICWATEDGENVNALNIWRPVAHVAPVDWARRVAPFLDHLAYLVPVEAERERFLDWLAHIEQFPGIRPHSHYLMIAPVQGIGRNYVGSVLARVWPGYTALNFDIIRMFGGGFNGRLSGKLLAVVDEIAEGGKGGDRWAHAETMKSLLTAETIDINVKYGLQRTERCCLRFLFLSNHLTAIPLDDTDRRFNVIENPSTPMAASYYAQLYGLLRDPLYIASVREMLRQRDLDGYNPHERPDMNEAKREMIAASQPEYEQNLDAFVAGYPHDLIRSGDLITQVHGALTAAAIKQDPDKRSRVMNQLRHALHRRGGGGYRRPVKMPDEKGNATVDTRVTILRRREHWLKQDAREIRRALVEIDALVAASRRGTELIDI